MALQVNGKTALVTGGGSGICLEFTKLLLEKGCNVLIADLKLTPDAEAIVSSTGKEGEGDKKKARALFKQTDVADWTQLQAAFDECMSQFGNLDIVCPGAGIFEPPWSNFWHLQNTVDTIDTNSYKTLELNLTHPIRVTQLALDYFKHQNHGHGVVILVSSVAAQSIAFPVPLYGASKAGISSFTRSLGLLEPKLNIRVSAVAPGLVKTPLWTEDKLKWFEEAAGDEWVTTEEVASAMLDMVEKEEYVGGTVLEVGKGARRKVENVNDPGPDREKEGYRASGVVQAVGRVFGSIESEFGK
ncbi:NAD(P)-binding protein [Mollisia scopiformis]|uniref:NAD(P)-binding protein n=1 Tax=Mollisia scopiformis TaxID=149040 RepID=A0A194XJ14_MOLSC|nr:NAD(P)-binding protein [Mollisia scopiformis]KUJ20148.1 NAD(P)-binding protein [Mollisia scopiformis]